MFRGYADFTAFYTAGKILSRGQGPSLYDRRLQWEIQSEFASTVSIRNGPLPYIRPPFQAVLFLPLAYLSYSHAFLVWLGIKLGLLLYIAFLLSRNSIGSPLLSPWITWPLSLAVAPVAMDLLQGQDAILFLLICVLFFVALSRGSGLTAGIWLGLGLFKFHLILPVLAVLLLRKQARLLIGFLATALCLLLISAVLVGWKPLLFYPRYLWNISQTPGSGVIPAVGMANLRGMMCMLSQSPHWLLVADWLYLPLAFFGLTTAIVLWPVRRENRTYFAAGFCFSWVVAILVSFYFSGYDMMLLLLPLFLLARPVGSSGQVPPYDKWVLAITLGFLLLMPIFWTRFIYVHVGRWDGPVLVLFAGALAHTLMIWRRKAPSLPAIS